MKLKMSAALQTVFLAINIWKNLLDHNFLLQTNYGTISNFYGK